MGDVFVELHKLTGVVTVSSGLLDSEVRTQLRTPGLLESCLKFPSFGSGSWILGSRFFVQKCLPDGLTERLLQAPYLWVAVDEC